jgi:serine/arginine repetitive matrix protein 2
VSGGVPRGSEIDRPEPVRHPEPVKRPEPVSAPLANRSQPPTTVVAKSEQRIATNRQRVPTSPTAPIGLASSKWSSPYMHAGTRPFDPQINPPVIQPTPQRVVKLPPEPAKVAETPAPVTSSAPSTPTILNEPEEHLTEQKTLSSIATQTSPSASPPPQPLSLEQSKHASKSQVPETMLPTPAILSDTASKSDMSYRSVSPHTVQTLSVPATTMNGIRHEPPGRTASPVKPALKHGGRNGSPAGVVVIVPEKDHSEPADQATTEAPKKKKSVRISVDVRPGEELDGMKTSRYAPPTPIKPAHPQHSHSFEEDIDDIMQPRPALPSFGSIRGQSKEHDFHENSLMQHPNLNLDDSGHSNDYAIGGILRQTPLAGKGVRREDEDGAKTVTRGPEDPIPPEVTSVEGTGLHSDSSEESLVEDRSPEPKPVVAEKKEEKPAARVKFQPDPVIETQKPKEAVDSPISESTRRALTPVPEEKEWYIPGAFPDDEEDHAHTSYQSKYSVSFAPLPDIRDNESSDDNSSIYSDAEEELDGTGFASLDAVLEGSTPMAIAAATRSFSQGAPERPSQSPQTSDLEKRLEEARINREEQERDAVIPTVIEPLVELPAESKEPTQEPESVYESRETKETIAPENSPRVTTPETTPQSSLASSKWSPTSRFNQAVGQLKALRRNSGQSPTRATLAKSSSPTRKPEVVPVLRRTNSNDSASSFQRNRASAPERTTLKTSLRSDNQSTTSPRRNLSPSGSLTGGQRSMRTSLRGSASPVRHETQGSKPSRFSSLIRTSRSKAGKVTGSGSGKPQSKFTSRFSHDSDSESEMPSRAAFKSRFADDSDDEDFLVTPTSTKMPKVRGIPRPSQDDDAQSTDLEGENTDTEAPASQPPKITVKSAEPLPAPKSTPLGPTSPSPLPSGGGLSTSRYALDNAQPSPSSTPRPSHRRWRSVLLFGSSTPPPSASPQHGRSQSTATARSQVTRSPTKLRRGTRPDGAAVPAWPLRDSQKQQPAVGEMGGADDALVGGERTKMDMGKRRSTADDVLELKVKEMLVATTDDSTSTPAKEDISLMPPPPSTAESQAVENEKTDLDMTPVPGSDKKKRFGRWKKLIKLG